MKKIKVIIACGSGAVTSSLCKNVVSDLAKEAGLSVEVTTCSAMELPSLMEMYDVKLTTMPYKFPEETKHCMNIFPLITGMNAKKCKTKISEMLIEVANEA